MDWPPKANFPPRDWYDWGMTAIACACAVTVAVAVKQIILG